MAGVAESCRAIHTCAPHVPAAWQRMLRTDISGDAFAFPPSHLQHPEGQGGEHLMPFPDLAVRNKEGLEDVTGAHTDCTVTTQRLKLRLLQPSGVETRYTPGNVLQMYACVCILAKNSYTCKCL